LVQLGKVLSSPTAILIPFVRHISIPMNICKVYFLLIDLHLYCKGNRCEDRHTQVSR
jgi:hypothetical protein